MSGSVAEELSAVGSAQVIVIPKEVSSGTVQSLATHFSTGPSSVPRAISAQIARRRGSTVEPPSMIFFPNLGVMLGTVDKEGLASLKKEMQGKGTVVLAPSMSIIRPVEKVALKTFTDSTTWGIRKMKVPQLWKQGLTGKGVLVGHLDTGADGSHPALKTAIASFAEFDLLGRKKPGNISPYDTDDHGTHTAATIAGRSFNKRALGVAPGCDLASAIVIEGGNVVARILGGMDWTLGAGVRVLSMSLGLRGWWTNFQAITRILRMRGVLPVFASGNEGAGFTRSPGNYPECLSVGASDKSNRVASFSSSQRFDRPADPLVPDLVGPGVDVVSAKPGGGFQSMSGTSMATPHITGLAALLLEARPQATVDQLEEAIFGSCKRPATMPEERANRGLPDGVKALDLLA